MGDNLKVLLAALGGVLFAAFSGGMMGGGAVGTLLSLIFWLLLIALLTVLNVWVVQQIQR
jgi:hypothetical protein